VSGQLSKLLTVNVTVELWEQFETQIDVIFTLISVKYVDDV